MLRQRANPTMIMDIQSAVTFNRSQNTGYSNFYINQLVFTADEAIPVPSYADALPDNLERDTVIVFADDKPLYNWAHPCRYLLFDADSREQYASIDAEFPPFFSNDPDEAAFRPFLSPVVAEKRSASGKPVSYPDITQTLYNENGYAILYSGNSSPSHLNDLEFAYRILTRKYGYNPAHISVLNYNGKLDCFRRRPGGWPGDGSAYSMVVDGPGDYSHMEQAFINLAKQLDEHPDASLFIHTSNHGGAEDAVDKFLLGHGGGFINSTDFGDMLASLPPISQVLIMMEQCNGGGFIGPILQKSTAAKTAICCACDAKSTSISGEFFNPYAMHWLSAINGLDPFGNPLPSNPYINGVGYISAYTAHQYASNYVPATDNPIFGAHNSGDNSGLG